MKSLRFLVLVVFCGSFLARAETAPGKARHVVVVVWDGMRPDFVSENHTPTLWKLAREGVTFRNHHAAYLSATLVNGTAIATGCYPSSEWCIRELCFPSRNYGRKNDRCRRSRRCA